MSTQHNATAYHRLPRRPQVPIYSSRFFSFCLLILTTGVLLSVRGTFQLDLLVVTKLLLCWEEGVLWLSVYRCHGKARGEWFSVASDFQYLFSIRSTYLQKKKQHVERKWQAETHSLSRSFSLRSVFKQGGPITPKAPDQPHSIITVNPYSSIK